MVIIMITEATEIDSHILAVKDDIVWLNSMGMNHDDEQILLDMVRMCL